jgi:hypothetical protein
MECIEDDEVVETVFLETVGFSGRNLGRDGIGALCVLDFL